MKPQINTDEHGLKSSTAFITEHDTNNQETVSFRAFIAAIRDLRYLRLSVFICGSSIQELAQTGDRASKVACAMRILRGWCIISSVPHRIHHFRRKS
jgi:hypothetical protein